jgi:ribA/ribD-fused uncharacterized protein
VKDKTVLVKGEGNIMSNFAPCPIKAFGTSFRSVEHAYQFKKASDSGLFDEAEMIQAQTTAKLAKAKADELIPSKVAQNWEAKSIPTMKHLLAKKKLASPEFVSTLLATGNKKIVHNVASDKWGTGADGTGQNLFGKILMEFRVELRKENLPKKSDHMQPNLERTTDEQSTAQGVNNLQNTTNSICSTATTPSTISNTNNQRDDHVAIKPEVMLIGNLQLKGIRPDKLSKESLQGSTQPIQSGLPKRLWNK